MMVFFASLVRQSMYLGFFFALFFDDMVHVVFYWYFWAGCCLSGHLKACA
jgi:hypothetical protein